MSGDAAGLGGAAHPGDAAASGAGPADRGRAPLVGVSGYAERASWSVWRQRVAMIPQTYVDSVARAGGAAVLLPPQPGDGAADRVVSALDALVLSGGPDVDPARYGAEPGRHTGPLHPERDAWEFALARAALNRGVPLLGVCRGMQLLNVALGGDLDQHLPGENHRDVPAQFVRRTVRIEPGTRLAAVLGGSADVNCYHHQAVARLGEGLTATAWADDGTVEAMEAPGSGFVLGVQWHPETDRDDLRLFRALTAAGRGRAAG